MTQPRILSFVLCLACAFQGTAFAQQSKVTPAKAKHVGPEEKLKADQAAFASLSQWIYNDVDKALSESARTGKPVLFVFRCVPCEACSQFDRSVIEPDKKTAEWMSRFVQARITFANGLDLSRFQFDWDQSFHVVYMDKDGRVLGRFGTRSQRPEDEDMTAEGFRASMQAVIALHGLKDSKALAAAVDGKKARTVTYPRPELMPTLLGTYASTLSKSGNIARSCIHCHQIRDAERNIVRDSGSAFDPKTLFPYPLPDTIGVRLSPDHSARVLAVQSDSPAAAADLRPGDEILRLNGQVMVSPADVQWVLEGCEEKDTLKFEIGRAGSTLSKTIELKPGWRAKSDLTWRPTSWNLRRMATGGLRLENMDDADYDALGLDQKTMALRVKHVGQFGEHATAKKAGFKNGDVILAVDDRSDLLRETDLFAYALDKPKGTEMKFTVLRDGKKTEMTFPTR